MDYSKCCTTDYNNNLYSRMDSKNNNLDSMDNSHIRKRTLMMDNNFPNTAYNLDALIHNHYNTLHLHYNNC